MFLETMYGDPAPSQASSRAPTPMVVRVPSTQLYPTSYNLYPSLPGAYPSTGSPKSIRVVSVDESMLAQDQFRVSMQTSSNEASCYIPSFMRSTAAHAKKYITKSSPKGEFNAPAPTPRRNLLQRPSTLPQLPDVNNLSIESDHGAEYAILFSMYEVYNDRIFDLLTPAIQGKSMKEFRRRPLLFKPTEMSPDRKVVAGLRKIICGNMKEALMVMEAGLHERRVAGTGSNSVSSRSHGFICVEVKKRHRSRRDGDLAGKWGGSALTIVDLAGSERARDAKTQGQTLAEAGKINESLMYLGQCLQMQSDLSSSSKVCSSSLTQLGALTLSKPNLVPFRQCKLTELLFSNSFPSSSSTAPPTLSHHVGHQYHLSGQRNPQKAIMIVTADPLGDFNATSQILRYSALAREVTVPRIPSVTSVILAQSASSSYFSQRPVGNGRTTPSDTDRETMEIAALEIARMSEEIDGLRFELAREQERRLEVEAHLETAREDVEGRILDREAEVREECYVEMESKLQQEMQRWKATWATEADLSDEHMDKKLEILTRTIDSTEDEDKENRRSGMKEDLESENESLKREVILLRRDLQSRSPSKRSGGPLRELSGMEIEMDKLRISNDSVASGGGTRSPSGSPVKKVKKLRARKWDLMDEEELL